MKLICDKCDKEIEDYWLVIPTVEGVCRLYVNCHGKKEFQHLSLNRKYRDTSRDIFNPSDYGDIHFFKKDEAPKSNDGYLVKAKKIVHERKVRLELAKDQHDKLHADMLTHGDPKDYQLLKTHQDAKIKELTDELELLNKYHKKQTALVAQMQGEIDKCGREKENKDSIISELRAEVVNERGFTPLEDALIKESHVLRSELVLLSTLTWTKAKPTKEARYLYRDDTLSLDWDVYRVVYGGVNYYAIVGENISKKVNDMNGEWANLSDSAKDRLDGYCLTWTKAKPTEPGKYLIRWTDEGAKVSGFAEVYRSLSSWWVRIYCPDYSSKLLLSCVTGEWAGPIPEPVDDYINHYTVGVTSPAPDCCISWKNKNFRHYGEFAHGKIPFTDKKFQYCPECGKKLCQ